MLAKQVTSDLKSMLNSPLVPMIMEIQFISMPLTVTTPNVTKVLIYIKMLMVMLYQTTAKVIV